MPLVLPCLVELVGGSSNYRTRSLAAGALRELQVADERTLAALAEALFEGEGRGRAPYVPSPSAQGLRPDSTHALAPAAGKARGFAPPQASAPVQPGDAAAKAHLEASLVGAVLHLLALQAQACEPAGPPSPATRALAHYAPQLRALAKQAAGGQQAWEGRELGPPPDACFDLSAAPPEDARAAPASLASLFGPLSVS